MLYKRCCLYGLISLFLRSQKVNDYQTLKTKCMKKKLLILSLFVLLLVTKFANAQLINPGFETWTTDMLVPTAMNPNSGNATTGWQDFNYFNSSFAGSSPVSVTRCTDTVHSGSYSARIQTKVYTPTSWNIYKNWGTPFIGHIYSDTLGILFNGNSNEQTGVYSPGIPLTQKITQFKFYYQYKPFGNDTAQCRVSLMKARTLIAGGIFKTSVATGSAGWQQATITFTYVSNLTPDTLWVLYSASSLDKNPKAGSVLWIDDASVTLPTGINQLIAEDNSVKIFPNPSNGIFTIQQTNLINEDQIVEIYNVLGEKTFTFFNNKNSKFDIDISQSPKGIYFVKLYNGEKFQIKKIVIH